MSEIKVTRNGPYEVHGLELVRLRYLTSESSAEQEWLERDAIDTSAEADEAGTYFLCRCGNSANKPFCDGSHSRVGFDGTETALTTSHRERSKVYEGPGGVVRVAAKLCSHAGFCLADGSNAWSMVSSDDPQVHAGMARMVDHCPSGTLTRAHGPADAYDIEADLPLRVAVVDDGPYVVTGGASVLGSEGVAYEVRNRMTLCRCGRSGQMPFCDGTHEKIAFRDS